MSQVEIDSITHRYGRHVTLCGLSLNLAQGNIGCLMGPSGSGKTTVLNCISGLEHVDAGTIKIKGHLVSGQGHSVAPEKRRIGMVFQDLALFPHLTIRQNVAFGVHESLGNRDVVVDEMLALCDLSGQCSNYPHELSGGQQQRAALARALAPKPDVLLLDEPFSSLDAGLRDRLRGQVRDILKSQKTTTLIVTHNQSDAFAMADEAGIIHQGVICQWDTMYNLYYHPNCAFVANFLGDGVLLLGELLLHSEIRTEIGTIKSCSVKTDFPVGASVKVLVRPDSIFFDDNSKVRAMVEKKTFRGADVFYTLRLESGLQILSRMSSRLDFSIGDLIGVGIHPEQVVLLPA